ncbi:flagellin [Roseibium hamelinense]|nr:flagellin [Roseibium hamelinense]
MTALQTLTMTNKNLATTQNRISTGLRINDAADNAAYWSIATTMRSDNKALSTVQDSLGLGAATLDTTFTALNESVNILDEIKTKVLAAQGQTPANRAKIQEDITQLQSQLQTYANSAVTSSGDNWLARDTLAQDIQPDIVGSFTRDSQGNTRIEKITVDLTDVVLIERSTAGSATGQNGLFTRDLLVAGSSENGAAGTGTTIQTAANTALGAGTADLSRLAAGTGATVTILNLDITGLDESANDNAVLEGLGNLIDKQIAALTDAATTIGSAKKRVDSQMDFISALSDSYSRGIGQLVDADMNAESTRLQALQTQQQLGIQALSIANQGSQNILSLFR